MAPIIPEHRSLDSNGVRDQIRIVACVASGRRAEDEDLTATYRFQVRYCLIEILLYRCLPARFVHATSIPNFCGGKHPGPFFAFSNF